MVGVFAAVLAVLSQISFPLPSGIPVTLQTLRGRPVRLCASAVSAARSPYSSISCSALSVCRCLQIFSGGFGSLVGLAGGYIYGFLPMAALCGLGTKMPHRVLAIVLGVAGLAACHLCGTIQFGMISGNGPWAAFLGLRAVSRRDIVSVAAAYGVATCPQFRAEEERHSHRGVKAFSQSVWNKIETEKAVCKGKVPRRRSFALTSIQHCAMEFSREHSRPIHDKRRLYHGCSGRRQITNGKSRTPAGQTCLKCCASARILKSALRLRQRSHGAPPQV